jgi:hypothetical protein
MLALHSYILKYFLQFTTFHEVRSSVAPVRNSICDFVLHWMCVDTFGHGQVNIRLWYTYTPNPPSVKVVLKGNGSEGLRPQLVRCAPFPSIALYFRMLYVSYPKIQMAIVVYPKVRTTIIWYPVREEGNECAQDHPITAPSMLQGQSDGRRACGDQDMLQSSGDSQHGLQGPVVGGG